jgi:hypothetical protein
LCLSGAVRYEGKLDPEFLESIERFVRPRKHAQLGLMNLLEPVGDRAAQLGRWRGKPGGGGQLAYSVFDDVSARLADPVPPVLVACLIGPEIA